MEYTRSQFLQFDGSNVKLNVKSVAEAKQALKELRVLKKTLALRKKELKNHAHDRRVNYTRTVRTQGPMARGRGGLSSFIRFAQTFIRSANRANLAKDLAPVEDEVQRLERHILGFDTLIIQLESFILQNSR